MADDDVQLTDLEVIQRYSLAVRGATASRAELVAALQADLDWLKSGRRGAAASAKADKADKEPAAAKAATPAATTAAAKAPAKAAAKRSTPAKRPAKG